MRWTTRNVIVSTAAVAVLLLAPLAAGEVESNPDNVLDYQDDYADIDYDAEADALYEYLMAAHELDEEEDFEPGGFIELTMEVNNHRVAAADTDVPELPTEKNKKATPSSSSNRRRLIERPKPKDDASRPKSYHGNKWEQGKNPCSPGISCAPKNTGGFFSWIYGLLTGGTKKVSKDKPVEVAEGDVDGDDDEEEEEEEEEKEDEEGGNTKADNEVEDDPDADFIEDGSPEDDIPEAENRTGRCYSHPQCRGKMHAFDPFTTRWSEVGKIYPEKPRLDPEPVQELASGNEVRACLHEKNVGCNPERAGHVCKAIQSQKAMDKVRKAHRGNQGCMNMVIKKGPSPRGRYRTCAVIANGPGFNVGFNKTDIIDSYDAVFRNNYFPWSDTQGFRTTWRTMNHKRMGVLIDRPKQPIIQPWLPKTTTYVGYALLTNPGTETMRKNPKTGKMERKKKKPPSLKSVGTKLSKRTGSGVFTIGPKCKNRIKNLFDLVKTAVQKMKVAPGKGKEKQLSAGVLNLLIALTKCEDVDIYGFGVAGGRMGSDSKVSVNKTAVVSDRMSHFHDWALEQAVVRYLVTGGAVDMC